ncbi:hypothetical protein EV648_101555 [Kribbella sp. VKM Ac-2568]|nr:hypothetical protein EV648_101555 [Kribbella sp. VKM Ac-2568]
MIVRTVLSTALRGIDLGSLPTGLVPGRQTAAGWSTGGSWSADVDHQACGWSPWREVMPSLV